MVELTIYDWFYGITQLAATFLSVVAGGIALTVFAKARTKVSLRAWKPLSVALVLFAVEEVIGAVRTFGVWPTPSHWTHILPGFILFFLIVALLRQIQQLKGWD